MAQQSVVSNPTTTAQELRAKFKEEVLSACLEKGAKKTQVAKRFGIERTTIYRWLKEQNTEAA